MSLYFFALYFFLTPADDVYYQELAEEYRKALKTKLKKRGFTIVDQPTPDSLIVNTKIGYKPIRLVLYGRVGIQVEIFQGDKLFSSFETTAITAHFVSTPHVMIRALASFAARTIKKHLK